MRDIPGFVETRYRLLQLRPNNRNNWVTFAVAHHLDGNYDMSEQIISAYESTVVRQWRGLGSNSSSRESRSRQSSNGSSSRSSQQSKQGGGQGRAHIIAAAAVLVLLGCG